MSQHSNDERNNEPESPKGHEPITPEIMAEATRRAEEQRLTGVGGWLITYIAYQVLNVLSFITSFGGDDGMDDFARYDPLAAAELERFTGISTMLGVVSVLGIIFSLFLISGRKKLAIRFSIGLLVAQTAFAAIAVFLMFSAMGAHLNDTETSIIKFAVALQMLLNVLWIAYFMKSRRVALTFTQ